MAEVLHRSLVRSQSEGASESVHLESWPEPVSERSDPDLETAMAAIQKIVRLGHAARNDHQMKTRQPLSSVTVVTADDTTRESVDPYLEILRQELNVREIHWAQDRTEYVHQEVRPNFRKCGPRFGKQMKTLQSVLAGSDGDELAADLLAQGAIEVELDGEAVRLTTEELELRMIEKEGMATQGDSEFLVALDGRLTEELIAEGRAREIVNRIQQRRKDLNLDYADRVRLTYKTDETLEAVMAIHRDWIASETLAIETRATEDDKGLQSRTVDDMEFAFEIETANGKES